MTVQLQNWQELSPLSSRLSFGLEASQTQCINQGLIVPLQELDILAPNSHQGFLLIRDKGDPDNTMTLLSEKSASLRPDGVIRSNDDRRLLMKWEEKANSLTGAVEDLRGVALLVSFCIFCNFVVIFAGHCMAGLQYASRVEFMLKGTSDCATSHV